jgi:hypothetical protein
VSGSRCPGVSVGLGAEPRPSSFALLAPEFPRTRFGGNSSKCIKTAAAEEHDYYRSLPPRLLGSVLPSQPKSSTLASLKLAAVCNAGRILMQIAA